MKKFRMVHIDFGNQTIFDENTVPRWLVSDEYNWFYTDHVLNLDVGENTQTDFNIITRIE